MEPSELGNIWEMQQHELLQQSSAGSVRLPQLSLESRKDSLRIEATQSQLFTFNPGILHFYLHVTT